MKFKILTKAIISTVCLVTCYLIGSCKNRLNSADGIVIEHQEFDSSSAFGGGSHLERLGWLEFDGNFQNASIISEGSISFNPQDGCIYDDWLFVLSSSAVCYVYNLTNGNLMSVSKLPSYNGFYPHSNSVCFGQKLYKTDPIPLIYTNVYNNYSDNREMDGMCFVYRAILDRINDVFSFEIVQVIKIGFTNNSELWGSQSLNKSPFGNFLVNKNELWVYLNLFDLSITRFFKFELPEVTQYSKNKQYVILSQEDIEDTFDTFLFCNIQGGTIFNNFLFSLEGFGDETAPSFLRAISLATKTVYSFELESFFGEREPEFIDFYRNILVIGTFDKKIYFVSL